MNILWPNDVIFSGLHDIFCIRTYSLTTFVKEVFWLEAPVKLWRNENFVTKWLHFSCLYSFPFLSNPCLSTFIYISCLSDPSLIKLNYYKVSLPYVHAHLCMLCTHAYSNNQKFRILMCHKVILITMPFLITIR